MDSFSHYLETIGEVGQAQKVNYPIIIIDGLPKAKIHELVIFEGGHVGEVFAIDKHFIEILTYSKDPVRVGDKVTRTDKFLSVPVGYEVLGQVLDPLGAPKSAVYANRPKAKAFRQIDIEPTGISTRARIKLPFVTGTILVDTMIPLGMGQKELVIGDRKTGKSSFLFTALKNHIMNGGISIYAGIGRRESDIKRVEEFFAQEGLFKQGLIVASTAHDPASLIYLTPYSAMTMAEWFRDMGHHVLVVFDDMSSHAKFYREISLLARRFPGRDSYPGDIFYAHAKLMERVGNYHLKVPGKGDKEQEVSITALPVVETVEGDFTGYVQTNIMGMTDGHIYFDSDAYYKGRRPAINIAISVTRVGRQTQSKLEKDINRELTAFLALYEKMQNFSHFGAELTDTVKHILETGSRIYNFFDQSYKVIVPKQVQVVLFSLLWLNLLKDATVEGIHDARDKMIEAYRTNQQVSQLFEDIINAESFNAHLNKVAQRKEDIFALCRISNT